MAALWRSIWMGVDDPNQREFDDGSRFDAVRCRNRSGWFALQSWLGVLGWCTQVASDAKMRMSWMENEASRVKICILVGWFEARMSSIENGPSVPVGIQSNRLNSLGNH